jgi:hypothetical protein
MKRRDYTVSERSDGRIVVVNNHNGERTSYTHDGLHLRGSRTSETDRACEAARLTPVGWDRYDTSHD